MFRVYEYVIPRYTDKVIAATQMIDFVYSYLNEMKDLLNDLNRQAPGWVTPKSDETILSALSFKYKDFFEICMIAYLTTDGTYAGVRLYNKSRKGIISSTIESTAGYSSGGKTIKFMTGVHSDYFIFDVSSLYRPIVAYKIDKPTNPDDKDAFYLYNSGTTYYGYYNKPFNTEDISALNVLLISDAGFGDSSEYSSNFLKNYYNQKIPVYNVYAFDSYLGVRGKISRLAMLPRVNIAYWGNYYQLSNINYAYVGKPTYHLLGGNLLLRY